MTATRGSAGGGLSRDLVVIGASAGGVETLSRVVAGLPEDLPATVCIVLHVSPDSPSALAHILHRAGPLPCRAACDGDALRPHEILVAQPNRHLEVENDRVRLTAGPSENGHRPAVDVLFRTAATARDRRVLGVILSGTRDDGTAGLAMIKQSGGAAIVQDPDEALYPGMPASAIANVPVDAVISSDQIAATIAAMVRGENPPPQARRTEPLGDPDQSRTATAPCPACGGVLGEHNDAGVVQWRCRVGHRYSPESLADAQADGVEAALWTAVRTLEDRAALLERMAAHSESRGRSRSVRYFRRQADAATEQALLVREALSQATASTLRKLSDVSEEDEFSAGAA